MLEAALALEKLGWSIIPLKPGEKKPVFDWKEWQSKRATPQQIRDWWTARPTDNIGVVTGRISGLVVLDFDTKQGIPDALAIAKTYPRGPLQRTGSGGLQVFFKHPGHEVTNNVGIQNPDTRGDIDVRADGGYVVVPPSLHPSGGRYEWIRPPTDPMDVCPGWLPTREFSTGRPKSPDWLVAALSNPIPAGARNDTLARVTGALLRKGTPPDILRLLLVPWWQASHADEIRRGDASCMREFDATVTSIVRAAGATRQSGAPDDGLGVTWGAPLSGRPPEWVVPGLLMAGSVQAVVGSPRAGKSWLTLILADAVAKGIPFLGRDVKAGRVIVAHEDSLEMVTQRLGRIGGAAADGRLHPNIGLVTNEAGSRTKFLDFKTSESQARSFDFLEANVQRFRPTVLVFDALYRMVNLHDYAAEAPQQLDPLVRIAREYNCAVIIVHHASKAGSENAGMTGVGGWGSIFLDAFLEGGWNLKREFEDTSQFIIKVVTDFKNGQGAQYRLRLTINEHNVEIEELLFTAEEEGKGAVSIAPLE